MLASNNEKGFTLLEILIAIVILSFMTFGVVQITDDAVNTKERTMQINEDNLQIETALARMDWDFSQAFSPLYFSAPMNFATTMQNPADVENPEISPQENYINIYREQLRSRFQVSQHFSSVSSDGILIPRYYAPDKSTFEFMTSSNRRKMQNTLQSHFAWVRYALEDAPADPEVEKNERIPSGVKNLVRYISNSDVWDDNRLDIEDIEKVKRAVLLENVENLEFQFWDLEKRKWETNLRSIKNGENLIRGVKMDITWYDESGNKRELIKVFRTHWPLVTPIVLSTPRTGTRGSGAGAGGDGSTNNTSNQSSDDQVFDDGENFEDE